MRKVLGFFGEFEKLFTLGCCDFLGWSVRCVVVEKLGG